MTFDGGIVTVPALAGHFRTVLAADRLGLRFPTGRQLVRPAVLDQGPGRGPLPPLHGHAHPQDAHRNLQVLWSS